jgi:hypothetical protein
LTSPDTKDLPAAVNDRSPIPDRSTTAGGFPREALAEHLNATQ